MHVRFGLPWGFRIYVETFLELSHLHVKKHGITFFYQLPLILTALLHVAWYALSISQHVSLSGHDDVAPSE